MTKLWFAQAGKVKDLHAVVKENLKRLESNKKSTDKVSA